MRIFTPKLQKQKPARLTAIRCPKCQELSAKLLKSPIRGKMFCRFCKARFSKSVNVVPWPKKPEELLMLERAYGQAAVRSAAPLAPSQGRYIYPGSFKAK